MKKFKIDNKALKEIRDNASWKEVFNALGLKKDPKQSKENDWWAKSPFTSEKTASFHMNKHGFYCFSSGENGGVIELVQRLIQTDCYKAGQWLIDNGLSHYSGADMDDFNYINPDNLTPEGERNKDGIAPRSEGKENLRNLPIKYNLLPLLTEQGEHQEFVKRGISRKTCEYLGCGFLSAEKLKNANNSMRDRVIFQVRGVQNLQPVILSHIGRATNSQQIEKWRGYSGFHKSLEIYNIDKMILDGKAISQAKNTGAILIVEGCFDVAKLVEAGIYNVIATFGADLAITQLSKIELITQTIGIKKFIVWYDQDKNLKGDTGQEKAVNLLKSHNYEAVGFNWGQIFGNSGKTIPKTIKDPCDFSVEQLQWLRKKNLI